MREQFNGVSLNGKPTDTFSDTTRTITKFEEVVLRDDWGRGRELFESAVRGVRRVASRLKHWWLHWVHRKSNEAALERYYLTEYRGMHESFRRTRINRDIVKMQSYS